MEEDASARFGAVFEVHYDELLAYCARRIGRNEAEDVAAEVFAGVSLYLHLAPLSLSAVTTLAGDDVQRVYDATGGNPFYVTELLTAHPAELPPSAANEVLGRASRHPQVDCCVTTDLRRRRYRSGHHGELDRVAVVKTQLRSEVDLPHQLDKVDRVPRLIGPGHDTSIAPTDNRPPPVVTRLTGALLPVGSDLGGGEIARRSGKRPWFVQPHVQSPRHRRHAEQRRHPFNHRLIADKRCRSPSTRDNHTVEHMTFGHRHDFTAGPRPPAPVSPG